VSKSNQNFLELFDHQPIDCPPHEERSGCVNECGRTCKDFAITKICPQYCKFNACTCERDYVRDPNTNQCVKPWDCSVGPECGPNEQYYPCGSCIGTCDKPQKLCTKECRKRGNCDCFPDFVRNSLNVCVPLSQCPIDEDDQQHKTCDDSGYVE